MTNATANNPAIAKIPSNPGTDSAVSPVSLVGTTGGKTFATAAGLMLDDSSRFSLGLEG